MVEASKVGEVAEIDDEDPKVEIVSGEQTSKLPQLVNPFGLIFKAYGYIILFTAITAVFLEIMQVDTTMVIYFFIYSIVIEWFRRKAIDSYIGAQFTILSFFVRLLLFGIFVEYNSYSFLALFVLKTAAVEVGGWYIQITKTYLEAAAAHFMVTVILLSLSKPYPMFYQLM